MNRTIMKKDLDKPITNQVDIFGSIITENTNKPRTYHMTFVISGDEHRSSFSCMAYSEKQAIGYMKKILRERKIYKVYDLEVNS